MHVRFNYKYEIYEIFMELVNCSLKFINFESVYALLSCAYKIGMLKWS